jgi:hypothetical protein
MIKNILVHFDAIVAGESTFQFACGIRRLTKHGVLEYRRGATRDFAVSHCAATAAGANEALVIGPEARSFLRANVCKIFRAGLRPHPFPFRKN